MNLTSPIFADADAARAHLEKLQWANGRACPHCGTVDNSVELKGKSTRPGVYKCRDCRKPFSVTVGTLFERSHIPLNKWLLAVHLLCASKKGMSSHQLMRMLDVTYKTAWFMSHRIREAMAPGPDVPPMGSDGGAVEADETYIGRKKGVDYRAGGGAHKMKIVTLLDRDTGAARSTVIPERMTQQKVTDIVRANVAKEARLMTDESQLYKKVGAELAAHEAVNHSKEEYARYSDIVITTNTVEGFFSIFKRGMRGVYQHCGEQHLQRYLREFDFRYSHRIANGVNDTQRAEKALAGIVGKRLTYRRIDGLQAA
ncbi:MAG: IS1595 family transposase [Caulobacter sp.]|nr:IS1595 family transposase [Caulobacter sp.]